MTDMIMHEPVQQQQPVPGPRLGKLIEERRHQLSLTKAEAARRAGINRGTWHDAETGTRTTMMPDTLNLIDLALQWEPGTLYRMTRPETQADIVLPQPDGTVVIVEAKVSNRPEISGTARRRALVSLAATLEDDELQRVLDFVARELHTAQPVVTREEIERMRTEIEQGLRASLIAEVHRVMADTTPA
jgi:DNA-binding XRE family transcriptional regulator